MDRRSHFEEKRVAATEAGADMARWVEVAGARVVASS